jgi:4-diphosphocytidyl-2-C-methyl-D-erythritol kinase
MLTGTARAKINLALLVGPLRTDGKHEIATVVDKLDLADTIAVTRADTLTVHGFESDSLVRAAIAAVADRAGFEPGIAATIEKRLPVAAGLGGGSSDAATALRLANSLLGSPLTGAQLHKLAAALGADVPLFLRAGPVLCTGDGTTITPQRLPRDYHVVLWLPQGREKASTASVYRRFDERRGEIGFDERRRALDAVLANVRTAADLAELPPNDLAQAEESDDLLALGAFRADVSGAGPTLYGLFADADDAERAGAELGRRGRAWVTAPAADG